MHGCKWTASFDNVVQLESQDYNVVLQGDMKSPNTFASRGRSPRVSHHQPHSLGHGKHANIANNYANTQPPNRLQITKTIYV